MEKVYKALSAILHPIFLPLIGSCVYLNVLPLPMSNSQKYLILLIVGGATFLVPLLTIILLRSTGYVKSIQSTTINERKKPVFLMIVNYLFLAIVLSGIWQLKELIILAYATALGLAITMIYFYKQVKISLHMLGMAGILGFTIVYGISYNYPISLIALLFIITGLLATARLKLNAHNLKEIIMGFCLGLFLPVLLSFVL